MDNEGARKEVIKLSNLSIGKAQKVLCSEKIKRNPVLRSIISNSPRGNATMHLKKSYGRHSKHGGK